jgi:hypothetical protein
MTWWENGSASQYFLSTISVVALRQRQTARTTLLAVEASRLICGGIECPSDMLKQYGIRDFQTEWSADNF